MNFQEEHGAEGGGGVRVHVDPQHGLLLQLRLLLHGQAYLIFVNFGTPPPCKSTPKSA